MMNTDDEILAGSQLASYPGGPGYEARSQ